LRELRLPQLEKKRKKLNDLRQPQLGKNLNNWTKNFELRQPQLEKIGKNN